MAGTLSIRRTISDSYSFAVRAALPSLPWLVLFAAGMMIYAASTLRPGVPAGSAVSAMSLAWWLPGISIAFITGVFYSTALYHLALPERQERTPGSDVWRLLRANAAVYALSLLISIIVIVFLSIAAGILINASGYQPEAGDDPTDIIRSMAALSTSGGAIVLYVLMAMIFALLIWLAFRLMLYGVATVAGGRIMIFQTWPWTKGYLWKLQIITTVALLAPYLVSQLLIAGLSESLGYPSVFSLDRAMNYVPDGMLIPLALAFAGTLITAPVYLLGHGMAASIYRQISPHKVDVEATFG